MYPLLRIIFIFYLTTFVHGNNGKEVGMRRLLDEIVEESNEDKIRKPSDSELGKVGGNATATFSITISSDEDSDSEVEVSKDSDISIEDQSATAEKPRPPKAYFGQLQKLLSQFLSYLGFRSRVERKSRRISIGNELDEEYEDGLRTTMGAVFGRKDCVRKVACRTGKYIKEYKAREFIIVIMERMVPLGWTDMMDRVRDSALHDDQCEYRCLDF